VEEEEEAVVWMVGVKVGIGWSWRRIFMTSRGAITNLRVIELELVCLLGGGRRRGREEREKNRDTRPEKAPAIITRFAEAGSSCVIACLSDGNYLLSSSLGKGT